MARGPPTVAAMAHVNGRAVLKLLEPKNVLVAGLLSLGLFASIHIDAHHSFAAKFDGNKPVRLVGTMAERYMDVDIRYLPISAAFALRDVMALLAPQNKRISVAKMSDLEPGSLKAADIIYIGYLSGMGMFQDLAFAGSRFAVGDSYDEVIDNKTHHSYVSQVGRRIMDPPRPNGREQSYHDYGLFEKLRGSGNTILVIAGTRDEGVSQTAEAFTSEQKLKELEQQTDATLPFEALLEVSAFDGTNLSGKVVLQSTRIGAVAKK